MASTLATQFKSSSLNQNRLIDAASKLFSIASQLRSRDGHRNLTELRKYLVREIDSFQVGAHKLGYNDESILISRYAIAACLDEIISQIDRSSEYWNDKKLLDEIQPGTIIDEHFYIILDKICQVPNCFIDVIELMYICLSLGFKGRFRNQPFSNHDWQHVIDNTYQVIRAYRGEFDKRLSPWINMRRYSIKKRRGYKISFWTILIFVVPVFIGIVCVVNYMLQVYIDSM